MAPVRKRKKTTFEWFCTCARCGRKWKALGDDKPVRCPSCAQKNWERAPLWRKPPAK